jgi:hypothetical protein
MARPDTTLKILRCHHQNSLNQVIQYFYRIQYFVPLCNVSHATTSVDLHVGKECSLRESYRNWKDAVPALCSSGVAEAL